MATPSKAKPLVSRIEQFILDKLSTSRFKKLRVWLQRNVQRYDKYLLGRHLREQTTKLVEWNDAGILPFKTAVLATQAKHIISASEIDIARPSEDSIDTLAIASKATDELYNLNDLIGLQPLDAPVGLVYQLRYKKYKQQQAEEIKVGDAPKDGIIDDKLCLEVVSQATEVVSRKLKASYTIEAMQDLKSMYALDLASELVKAIGSEIANEYTQEVLSDLIRLGELPIYETAPVEVVTEVPAKKVRKRAVTKVEEASDTFLKAATPIKFTDIIFEINKAAAAIGHKTRRGMGNVIVCSPVMISMLQADPKLKFEMDSSGKFKGPASFMYVGMLNSTYRVYSSMHEEFKTKVLVAYKGKNGQCDTGYILSPYVLVLPAGMTIDGATFQPAQRFLTRYGKTVMTELNNPDDATFGLSQNYYRTIDVTAFIEAFKVSAPY